MKKVLSWLLPIVICMVIGPEERTCALQVQDDAEFLGTVTLSPLERYAVIKDIGANKQHLYRLGDSIQRTFRLIELHDDFAVLVPQKRGDAMMLLVPEVPTRGLEYRGTVALNTFEFRYRIAEPAAEPADKRFEVIGIHGTRAILERDYCISEEGEPPSLPLTEPVFTGVDTDRDVTVSSVDEVFFDQLKSKYMGNDVWIVDGKSVARPVVESAGKALATVADSVSGIGFDRTGPKVSFSCKSGSGTLSSGGLSVDCLSSEVKAKAGLIEGDVILAVNGKKVYTFTGMVGLFYDIKRDNIKQVNVRILRDNSPKTLTYLVK